MCAMVNFPPKLFFSPPLTLCCNRACGLITTYSAFRAGGGPDTNKVLSISGGPPRIGVAYPVVCPSAQAQYGKSGLNPAIVKTSKLQGTMINALV
jgi:hypothetical protein